MAVEISAYDPAFEVAGIKFFVGAGAPTFVAAKGSIYINTTGSSTSTRMYINSDGSTTWPSVTTSA